MIPPYFPPSLPATGWMEESHVWASQVASALEDREGAVTRKLEEELRDLDGMVGHLSTLRAACCAAWL